MRGRLVRVEALLGKLMEKVMTDNSTRNSNQMNRGAVAAEITQITEQIGSFAGQRTKSSIQKSQPTVIKETEDKFTKIRLVLHAALPSQKSADILIGAGTASAHLQLLCHSESFVFQGNVQPPLSIAVLPAVSSHPVLLARKLLQLAVSIQQLDPAFDDSQLDLEDSLSTTMTKYVDLATSLVTSNESLIDSLEGMECLVLEGVYLINSGNLRRAWFCTRRAVSIAQFLGLQRGHSRTLKVLDSMTQCSPSMIWFRIVYGERYLSLLLGNPSGVTDNTFASEESMKGVSSTERLDRVHAVIFGLIIERNESRAHRDFAMTQKIDFDLQRAAKSLPSNYWLPPNFTPGMHVSELLSEVMRAQTQIIHHNLLILLHLPHMLRHAAEMEHDYSKSTCIHSSREILSRFITFRAAVRVVYCCRLVDFSAFTAALTLLLAHLGNNSSRHALGAYLAHQRLQDRALVERTLLTMDELTRVNNDALSRRTAEVARRLLAMETDSATAPNSSYTAKRVSDAHAASVEPGFRLEIPYFGTVSIVREGAPALASRSDGSSMHGTFAPSSTSTSSSSPWTGTSPYDYTPSAQGATQNRLSSTQRQGGFAALQEATHPFVSLYEDSRNEPMPDFLAESDEWAFQGVDATFFDAVLNGDLGGPYS